MRMKEREKRTNVHNLNKNTSGLYHEQRMTIDCRIFIRQMVRLMLTARKYWSNLVQEL